MKFNINLHHFILFLTIINIIINNSSSNASKNAMAVNHFQVCGCKVLEKVTRANERMKVYMRRVLSV